MRAILFDFGGTLDSPRHWLDRFVTHYCAAGIDITRNELNRAFSIATQQAYARSARLRDYTLLQLVGFLVDLQFESLRALGAVSPDRFSDKMSPGRGFKELKEQICQLFVAESAAGLAASRPLLMSFARRLKVGVVSNFYGNLERILADADLAQSITAIADSGRLGCSKPDPRIFAASLEQLGVHSRETVMVGDSIVKDCAPARAMGMATVWLRHCDVGGCTVAPGDPVDFTIDRLEELKDFEWLTG